MIFKYYIKVLVKALLVGGIVYYNQNIIKFCSKNEEINLTPLFDTVSLSDVLVLIQKPGNIIIDARNKQFYDYSHIQGAISSAVIGPDIMARLKKIPNLIIYGNEENSDDYMRVGLQLIDHGVKNIKIYREGWTQWRACNLPIERGASK